MDSSALIGGFSDPAIDSAHAFRQIMQAMARPGTIHEVEGVLPPSPVSVAAGALIVTLCDATTGIHLAGAHDREVVRDWITFQTSAPIVRPEDAQFVLGEWDAIDRDRLMIGTSEYPDRSATLIVEMPELSSEGATLTGPGIKDTHSFGLPETEAFQRNRALFPLGLDFFFSNGSKLAALPRTTLVAQPEVL